MTRNRLQHERSPYLLQHAGNPVDWYPWGEEAFAKAVQENKPVFLSIGYSACHWCHVMEHESFEDPATAAVLNQHFVNIKVDREERPDIDQVYQLAYQVMQRRGGGWPLSMFMTPEKQPFFGGTYFPPKRRYGMPGFSELLHSIVHAWENKHEQVVAQGAEMARVLEEISLHTHHSEKSLPSPELLESAAHELLSRCDKHWGGFGTAPKFPNTMSLDLLLMAAQHEDSKAQDAFFVALARMAQGGIYDQLGGGFARYSVDERWLIPHFEKMLYDNAQLAKLYLDGYRYLSQHTASQLTQADCRRIVDETLTYLLREMTAPEGCFYSAQDADSEGEEGKFFVWTPREIAAVIGIDAAEVVCAYFDVTDEGNFEHGKSALWTPKPLSEVAKQLRRTEDEVRQRVAEARPKLFAAREQRIKPMRDDKCLASWNGLAITAFVEAGATLGRADWVEAAQKSLACWQRLAWRDGRLAHAIKDGEAYGTGYLDDYAGLGLAALSVFSCTGDVAALRFARELCDTLLDLFADKAHGDFFFTPYDAERVLHRPKESHDHAYPGGTGLTADLLLQLAALTGEPRYQEAADLLLHNLGLSAAHNPMGMSTVVRAVDRAARGSLEIILLGDETTRNAHRDIVLQQYIPHRVLVQLSGAEEGKEAGLASTLLAGRSAGPDGKTTAYVCRGNLCEAPVQDAVALRELLQAR